ncbi:repressor LexA [Nodosilinea sp. LEGE 06152]|uniref:LexA family protein n=1 Tax=Nodosilinea sp. LEGE 06152 TaxID=2777966 RepID=UPI001881F690|nr:LexA family transcriptional regulator [Nodosilinea sp. LEGE 06152]MBE9157755.1 repressor LexA [Nodosilinea sp. LEGE 06152]
MVLLPSERRLYDCLRQWISLYGYAPTIREMKEALKESSSSLIQDLLDRLQQKGFIVRRQGVARALCLLYGELPLKGFVQAGYLTDHPECCDRVRLDGNRYIEGDYALTVNGDSMVGAGILDGDIVVMRPTKDVWAIRPGQIAVIWLEGEGATLKRVYYNEGDNQVTLEPANSAHPTRVLERSRVGVQGVMVGQHRNDQGLWVAVAR